MWEARVTFCQFNEIRRKLLIGTITWLRIKIYDKDFSLNKFVISDKGISYLKNKKYKLGAVILPIVFSAIGIIISIIALLN